MTRGDRGLQRIIEPFFLTRTFPVTFSWSILNKKSKLKKSQIFDENDGKISKNSNFAFFINSYFYRL